MKILVSELWDGSHEVRILEHLSHGPASHPGQKHIIELLDQFKHEGPNSTHPCLVFEPLGPSVIRVIDYQAKLLGRLHKHLLTYMPMVLHTGVSYS